MRILVGAVCVSAIAAAALPAAAAGLSRAPLSSAATGFVNTHTQAFPLFKGTSDLGTLASSTPMRITVGMAMRNGAMINSLLKAQVTPGNAMYGKFLTPAQTTALFGPTGSSVQAVASYLTSAGFKSVAVTPDNMLITATGTAAIASKAFNTKIDVLSLSGKRMFANVKPAQVPAAMGSMVTAIEGLNGYTMHLNLRFPSRQPHGARAALGAPAPSATTSAASSTSSRRPASNSHTILRKTAATRTCGAIPARARTSRSSPKAI
jgi:subtilase family serine protease